MAPPLILVHPQGGGVLGYLPLARELGRDLTVLGLQAPGFDGDEEALTHVEAMADRYTAAIRDRASSGPFRLGGWSFGGTVALEVARRLEMAGNVVGFLGLIDAHPLGRDGSDEAVAVSLAQLAAEQLGLDPALLAGLEEEPALRIILERTKELGLLPPGATLATIRRQAKVRLGTFAAARTYEGVDPVKADIHLFRATDDPGPGGRPVEAADWESRTRGRVRVVDLSGTHHSLVELPHVRALAAALRAALDEGGRRR